MPIGAKGFATEHAPLERGGPATLLSVGCRKRKGIVLVVVKRRDLSLETLVVVKRRDLRLEIKWSISEGIEVVIAL